MEGGLSDTILKGGQIRTIPAKFSLIWFIGFRGDLNVLFYQNMRNLHNKNKSSERTFHRKPRDVCTDTILKGTHPRTISARFGLIWLSGFRGDLNMKVYHVVQQMDAK